MYKAEETAPCIPHPGCQHDLNLVQPMVSPSRSSKAIRLRFPRSNARRQGIRLHHQLQGRLCRASQARGPESERCKRSHGRHTSWHTQVVPRRRHRTGAHPHDSGSLSYSQCSDSNAVSATPRPTSQRPLPQGRRYGITDHE